MLNLLHLNGLMCMGEPSEFALNSSPGSACRGMHWRRTPVQLARRH